MAGRELGREKAGLFSQLASVLGRTQCKFKRLGVGLLLPLPPTPNPGGWS